MLWRLVLVCVLLGGCYDPRLQPCTVRCRLTFDCPSGMSCGEDAFCHGADDEAACACAPLRCEDVPDSCGEMPDTCGGTVSCGDCAAPEECGAGGIPNVCADPALGCTPLACSPNDCGTGVDSCGKARTCPQCAAGKKCQAGRCVACTPQCANESYPCGDDGCGGSCGSCPDARFTCMDDRYCCIAQGQSCNSSSEGGLCCNGAFCLNGTCQ